jgi:hypothetical protein
LTASRRVPSVYPEGAHGLGTLLLDVLARVSGLGIPERALGANVSVEREVITGAGNRIDLLVQSDGYDILIENKIFAAAENPFDDYAAFLTARRPLEPDRAKLKFLFTLTPTNDGHAHGFHNVTHAQLVAGIRGQVGHYAARADTRYLTFLLDFLNTLDNLQVGTAMSGDFRHLVSQRKNDVEAFLDATKRLKDELRGKVNALAALIDVKAYTNVRQYFWRQMWSLTDGLYRLFF